jgi:hypothetical protein
MGVCESAGLNSSTRTAAARVCDCANVSGQNSPISRPICCALTKSYCAPLLDSLTAKRKPAVVVVAAEEYKRLQHLEALKAPNFADHLLAMPTDDGKFERLKGPLRETSL